MEKTAHKKNGFASAIGFILAAAGSAVGLGNLWGFPFKTSANGGAAFVFVYIACVIFIGAIIMIAEMWIGKRAQANTVTAYKKVNKGLGFFGLLVIVIPVLIITYYSVLGGYTIKYTVNSFAGNAGILGTFSVTYWEVILCTAIFLGLAVAIVMAGVKGGIENASKVLMPILFILLVGIVIYCLCLGDGVDDGLKKYLNPDFYAFFHDAEGNLSFKGLLAAMGQSFYSLSLGMGIMVAYGSYTGKEIKIGKSVAMICIFDTLVAFLAGLAIFPAIGALMPSALDSKGGVGLLFSVLPQVFANMGTIGGFVSFFFFAMVAIAAITSVISLLEVATQFVVQKFKLSRRWSVLVLAVICFVVSIPVSISLGKVGICEETGLNLFGFDILTFFDETTNSVLMPIGAFAGCLAVGWLIGKPTFNPMETNKMLKKDGLDLGKFGGVFCVMIKYITPVLIIVLDIAGIITNVSANPAYWSIVIFAIILIAISVGVYFGFLKDHDTGTNADEIVK